MMPVEEAIDLDAPARRPSVIRTRYGTVRGLVRLLLSYPQTAARRAHNRVPEPGSVRRLVFVCQGNICRSAFADVLTRDLGYDSISFGLSTDAGKPAHPPAMAAAADFGVDLSGHATTRMEDYTPRSGDFLLAMEVRQLARIAADPRLAGLPRSLLGLWSRPVRPHLHDPFGLDDSYMRTCMGTIRIAVANLVKAYPETKLSQ